MTTSGQPAEYDPMWWADRGACVGKDPQLWFPPIGGNSRSYGEAGKAICAECPVRVDCLTYALDTEQVYGTWGGRTTKERGQVRRLR